MKKIAKFGIVALLLVALVGSAFAFSGRGLGNDEARAAIESGDYGAWKQARMSELTEENFNQIRARQAEREEHRAEMESERAEIEAVISEGYDAWKEAVADHPGNRMTEVVTEENFEAFKAMHEAMQSGDFETADELALELGIEHGPRGPGGAGNHDGQGKRMSGNSGNCPLSE